MIRLAPLFAAAAILLCSVRPAFAAGGILTTRGDAVAVTGVRYAMAMSAAQTTRWASLRVAHFPGAMAWILPIRPGARVEEVGDAWLEALDLATAPRIVAPGCGDGGATPSQIVVEREPPIAHSARALRMEVLDDVLALRAFAQSWGFEMTAEMAARYDEVAARGFVFLALVYAGPNDGNATRTVRMTDDAFPWVPLFLTSAGEDALPVTTFVIADARTRLGPGPELAIDGARLSIAKDGTTNYAAELGARLLDARGESWVAEAANHDALFEGTPGPAGAPRAPAVAPTYFRLAAGDDHTDATDLGVALTGLDLAAAWLTRSSGILPPRTLGDDLAVTRRDQEHKSPFLAAGTFPLVCPAPDGGRVAPDGGTGGPVVPPSPPLPPPSVPPPTSPPSRPPRDPQPQASVGMSCSCSPGPEPPPPASGDDSCDGSDPGGASDPDEGCDGSADDGADDDTGDSCDGSTDDSSDSGDGCDGSSSSGSGSGSDDGCSSGSSDGNDGCSSTSSGSSQPSDGCSTAQGARRQARARHGKRRTHTSVVTLGLAAVALVVRRVSKRRDRAA